MCSQSFSFNYSIMNSYRWSLMGVEEQLGVKRLSLDLRPSVSRGSEVTSARLVRSKLILRGLPHGLPVSRVLSRWRFTKLSCWTE